MLLVSSLVKVNSFVVGITMTNELHSVDIATYHLVDFLGQLKDTAKYVNFIFEKVTCVPGLA